MAESGLMVDPSFVMDPKQRLTNSMVAKTAREKRRKIIADKKAKRCTASESVVVSTIKDSMVTQIARQKRQEIIAAKRAMRCTTSSEVSSNNARSSRRRTKSKGSKNSRSSDEKLQHDISEVSGPKPRADNNPTDA